MTNPFQQTIRADQADAVADLAKGYTKIGDGHMVMKKVATIAGGTTAEVDTGFDLPANAIAHEWFLDVKTAEATGGTKTVDVGLLSTESGGDADGFMRAVDVSSTGMKKCAWKSTVGANNTYLGAASTHTFGALMTGLLIAGEDVAAGGDGFAFAAPHMAGSVTSKSVSYSRGSTLTELVADLWVRYSIPA